MILKILMQTNVMIMSIMNFEDNKMTEDNRFVETISTGIVTDTVTGKEYNCEMRINDNLLNLMNNIAKENEELKSKLEESKKAHSNCDKLWWELHDEKEQLEKENQHLKSKINMLKVTIGRNEAHIKRLTEKSNWRTSAYD